MGKIFYVMGKSASGKDTIFRLLLKKSDIGLKTVVIYTTRPIRENETDGVEYHFSDEKKIKEFADNGKLIEVRTYHTMHGDWSYFTADDGQINLKDEEQNYLMIGTLESYEKMKEYYGSSNLVPVYIEVEDGLRLKRALEREYSQSNPKFAELCRRYLADEEDFSEDKLIASGIKTRYKNKNLSECLSEIEKDIRHYQNCML